MRLLLDNNILVRSLISDFGSSARLMDAWRSGLFELVSAQAQILRLSDVFDDSRLQRILPIQVRKSILRELTLSAIHVDPIDGISATNDDEDNVILGIAVAGRVDLIVTGDRKHLLPLGDYEGIEIVTPLEALERLQSVWDSHASN